MRFGFCSTAAIDYFRATHINGLPECLSEDWYESTEPGELPRIPGALRFICIRSFDTTVNLGRVAALVSDSMLAMEVHKPELQWCMGTFQLEGSVVHQKVPEQTQEPLYGWFGPATARMEARPPADSLAYRRRVSLSASPSPQPRLIHINSLTDPQPVVKPTINMNPTTQTITTPESLARKSSKNHQANRQTSDPAAGVCGSRCDPMQEMDQEEKLEGDILDKSPRPSLECVAPHKIGPLYILEPTQRNSFDRTPTVAPNIYVSVP